VLDDVQQGETPEEAIARYAEEYGGDLVVVGIVEAFRLQEEAAKTEPEEISAAEFDDKLNILPPRAWVPGFGDGASSFKIGEPYIGRVHSIYARLNGRFFTFRDDVRMAHDDVLAKVFHSAAYRGERDEEGKNVVRQAPER
jgi:hypothetical protein